MKQSPKLAPTKVFSDELAEQLNQHLSANEKDKLSSRQFDPYSNKKIIAVVFQFITQQLEQLPQPADDQKRTQLIRNAILSIDMSSGRAISLLQSLRLLSSDAQLQIHELNQQLKRSLTQLHDRNQLAAVADKPASQTSTADPLATPRQQPLKVQPAPQGRLIVRGNTYSLKQRNF